jgi:hypothetical protein
MTSVSVDPPEVNAAFLAGLGALADDPFARIFPGRVLRVDAGMLGVVPAVRAPTIER